MIESQHFLIFNLFRAAQSTAFFIEEPELNLYPTTQRTLVNTFTEWANSEEHTFFITTHSTYILTSLTNLIFAGSVGKRSPDQTADVIPASRWINKSDVSAWKINAETNQLENLLADDLSMLKAEKLDDVSTIINEEFERLFEIDQQDIDSNEQV